MKKQLFIIGLCLCLLSCGRQGNRNTTQSETAEPYVLEYAKGFTVDKYDGYTQIDVIDPWNKDKLLKTYLLVPDSMPVPEHLPKGVLIRTPLRKVVVYASAHCCMLEVIGAEEVLSGVCESRYVQLDFVKKGIAEGKYVDVGEAYSPSIEKIIDLEPDVIIASPIENMGYGQIEKVGIPLIESTDYQENTPLGRAEWIRFFGLLCGKEAESDSVFRQIVENYESAKALVLEVAGRPTVLPESPYPPVWYVPGGDSFMAHLYRDAGADYPWSDDESTGSISLSVESVLERGVHADIWVMKYNRPYNMTFTDLKNAFPGSTRFAAFQNKRIFACNSFDTPYYDEVPVYPDRVLRDLIWVFHPELMQGYEPRYFKQMTD